MPPKSGKTLKEINTHLTQPNRGSKDQHNTQHRSRYPQPNQLHQSGFSAERMAPRSTNTTGPYMIKRSSSAHAPTRIPIKTNSQTRLSNATNNNSRPRRHIPTSHHDETNHNPTSSFVTKEPHSHLSPLPTAQETYIDPNASSTSPTQYHTPITRLVETLTQTDLSIYNLIQNLPNDLADTNEMSTLVAKQ